MPRSILRAQGGGPHGGVVCWAHSAHTVRSASGRRRRRRGREHRSRVGGAAAERDQKKDEEGWSSLTLEDASIWRAQMEPWYVQLS
mmetsp:Transcript_120985/g.324772  ORF Transcript_120985/g.324772 Transcript_120985/m.324772 type:complete len:86 (-) Transcript_120985:2482-2739(-)